MMSSALRLETPAVGVLERKTENKPPKTQIVRIMEDGELKLSLSVRMKFEEVEINKSHRGGRESNVREGAASPLSPWSRCQVS